MGTLPAPKRPRRHAVATAVSHGTAPFEMAVPFGIAAGLRLHFRRVPATPPLVYRRTFRRIGA